MVWVQKMFMPKRSKIDTFSLSQAYAVKTTVNSHLHYGASMAWQRKNDSLMCKRRTCSQKNTKYYLQLKTVKHETPSYYYYNYNYDYDYYYYYYKFCSIYPHRFLCRPAE